MEPRRVFGNRKLIASLTASVLLILATVAWLERSSLWASYCVHKLAAAKAAELQIWAEHIAALDIAAVPKLLDYLSRTDAAACGNTEAGLLEIVRQWEPGDPRRADLAHSLAARFATFSVPGQQAALTIQAN